jgi:hypothetical protein
MVQRQRCAERVAAGEFDWLLDAMESNLAADPSLAERAAVVAWLRERAARWNVPYHGTREEAIALAHLDAYKSAADAIERGEHVEGRDE